MSKYHIRDKFVIEIDEVFENDADDFIHEEKLYRIKGFNSLVFDDNGLDKLQKYETFTVRPDAWDESLKEQYNKGLEDAWKLAQRITKYASEGGMSTEEIVKVFKCDTCYEVMRLSYQEALAKLEAYEKEQEEIKAGDYCVDEDGLKWLVTYVNKGELPNDIDYHCIDNKGYTSPVLYHKGELKKTGKHIDISSILEQIGGGE